MHCLIKHQKIDPQQWVLAKFIYPATQVISDKDIIVEIGPGRGDFLFHLAETNPDKIIYGIEIKRKRVDKLIKRIQKRKLNNVFIVQDDATNSINDLFEQNSVQSIYINFPDPWPKKRHTKNRLITEEFLNNCAKILKPSGFIYFTTDSKKYAEDTSKVFRAVKTFDSCYKEIISLESPESFPTFFYEKWIAMNRTIYYQKYQKSYCHACI